MLKYVVLIKKHWVFSLALTFWILGLGFLQPFLQANVHQDSGITFYSYLLSHHEEFKVDTFAYYSLHWIRGSLGFFIPVYLINLFNFPAQFFEILFLAIQISFIFIYFYSIYFYGKRCTC